MSRLGFIGLGAMGGAMARRLVEAGHEVAVCDLAPERVAAVVAAGARDGGTAAEVAAACPVILTSLSSPRAFAQVVEREVLPRVVAGAVLVDLGTSAVADTRRMEVAFAERGAVLVDAPVSGGPAGAAAGTLRIFVGGESEAVARVRPLLEVLARGAEIFHCGGSGQGQVVKAVNQLAMGLSAAVHLEAVGYGVFCGVEPAVLQAAVGGEGGWRRDFAQAARRVGAGEGEHVGVKAGQLADFLAASREQGFRMPLTEALEAFCRDGEKCVMEANRLSPSFWRELVRAAAGQGGPR